MSIEVEKGEIGERLLGKDEMRRLGWNVDAKRRKILKKEFGNVASRVGPEDCFHMSSTSRWSGERTGIAEPACIEYGAVALVRTVERPNLVDVVANAGGDKMSDDGFAGLFRSYHPDRFLR